MRSEDAESQLVCTDTNGVAYPVSQTLGRRLAVVLLVVLFVAIQGCASAPPRNPIPEGMSDEAEIPGIPNARNWGDVPPPYSKRWLGSSKAEIRRQYPNIFGREHNYLAISGGGANGAYGAGMLVGWTAHGTRPEFTVVTGISTGALMAPFAFLGPAYDPQLKKVYTEISSDDIYKKRSFFNTIRNDAAASSAPLKALIARFVDEKMMQAIADEGRKGRVLLITTTNLDAARPVVWNITKIARSGQPSALQLVRDIMLASSSIPIAFPPVMIEVELDGKRYDEFHVDGGVTSQVSFYPVGLNFRKVIQQLEVKGRPRLYLIRNSKLDPGWKTVKRKLVPITGRTVDSMIRTQGIGDLYRIYLGARRDGIDFRLTHIPADFDAEAEETFDPNYMGELFVEGYNRAKHGYPWRTAPPGVNTE